VDVQSLIHARHFPTDSSRHALSPGSALPARGSPPAHGGTPARQGEHPAGTLWPSALFCPPREQAANKGSPAQAAAPRLSHCRGSLCGASADPSLRLPCRQRRGGLRVMQVPLALCHRRAPVPLPWSPDIGSSHVRMGSSKLKPLLHMGKELADFKQNTCNPLLEWLFSGPGLTAGTVPSLCCTSE